MSHRLLLSQAIREEGNWIVKWRSWNSNQRPYGISVSQTRTLPTMPQCQPQLLIFVSGPNSKQNQDRHTDITE